jgi:SAM-dependent methyltransferase
MSIAKRVANKRLRRAVLSQFGARKPIRRVGVYDIDAQIALQSNPRLQEKFYPSRTKPYPLNQAGHELAKMPLETIHNFVPMHELVSVLGSVSEIKSLLATNPQLKGKLEKLARQGIRERGMKAAKFWETADKAYIDRIAAGGKGNPNRMNQITGKKISNLFGLEVKPRTIMDIGTFAGGTVSEVVAAMSPAQRKQLTVVLVDVARDIVKKYAVPQLVELGVSPKNIKVLPVGFYNASVSVGAMRKPLHEKGERMYAKEFIKLIGKVDAITAGAATINFAMDLQPYLKTIKTLLKKGGMFVNWDWGSAEVRQPSVNIPALKRAIVGVSAEGKKITHYDAYVSFLNFWMRSYGYPPIVTERLFSEINASQKFNFLEWLEKNQPLIEHQRKTIKWVSTTTGEPRLGIPQKVPFGFKNRAYRTGEAMQREATRLGLSASKPEYPIGKPGQMDTGNTNWLMTMRK